VLVLSITNPTRGQPADNLRTTCDCLSHRRALGSESDSFGTNPIVDGVHVLCGGVSIDLRERSKGGWHPRLSLHSELDVHFHVRAFCNQFGSATVGVSMHCGRCNSITQRGLLGGDKLLDRPAPMLFSHKRWDGYGLRR
jgi:hypothetical protein